jgi:class 3 adenylate cyclase
MIESPSQNTKTVLELDLAAYSDIASALEENLDVQAVKTFQDQIQSFVDVGLTELGLQRDQLVFATAGDNALLIFDDPAVMHRFAKIVQEATVKHNRKKSVESAKRWFRMGAATGAVLVIAEERRIVGTTVARAVRLEAAAEKGELIVDAETFDALPDDLKQAYGPEEIVAGKRAERFAVRRCPMVSLRPDTALPAATQPQKISATIVTKLSRHAKNWFSPARLAVALAVGALLLFLLNHHGTPPQPVNSIDPVDPINPAPNGQFEDLTMRELDPATRARLGVSATVTGVEVTAVKIDSSPYAAGMMPEDIITQISGQPISNISDVVRLCSGSPGETIAIQIWRRSDDGQNFHVLTVNNTQSGH